MSFPGGMEWVVILIVVVLLFGARKIPELAKGLGQGIKEFRKASREGEKDANAKEDASGEKKEIGKQS
jgi:sec-independent protein translocase protein TatA